MRALPAFNLIYFATSRSEPSIAVALYVDKRPLTCSSGPTGSVRFIENLKPKSLSGNKCPPRRDAAKEGFKVGPTIHKISLLADDIILYLINPFDTPAKLQTRLDTFGAVSGYKGEL